MCISTVPHLHSYLKSARKRNEKNYKSLQKYFIRHYVNPLNELYKYLY